jgi:FtsP/CotA-like multicopper oxidase with cupredoxin domain
MKDRALLVSGLLILVLGLVGLTLGSCSSQLPAVSDLVRPAAPSAVAPPWQGIESGQFREFNLTVARTQWELGPGKIVEAYAYNGRVPGPELRVSEGDTLRVTVTNELAEPTTIHWHGVELPVGMDGVPQLSQEPIPPGGTFTYEFVATPAGTRWYHSHFNELAQQGGGLIGALIVEPRQATTSTPDREYVVVTGEWVTDTAPARQPAAATPSTSGGMGGMMGRDGMGAMMGQDGMGAMMGSGSGRPLFDTFAVNGRAYPNAPPLVVRQGERVRLRLINAGATETQAFALAGHKLIMTHSDGNALAQPIEAEAVLLGVGERADVEFVADNPGRWQLRGLLPGHAERGLAVDVVYNGHEADATQGFPPGQRFRPARYADFAGPALAGGPDRTYELTLSGGMMGSDVWTINGRAYPNTDHLNVRPGERVRLKLFNMSMEDHPMHLHGHTFQLVGIAGRPVDGPLKDTLTVRHMEQYDIEFVANNPGAWLFHCHNLQHMGGGLMAELHYRP